MNILSIAFAATAVVDIIGYYPQIKRVINPDHELKSLSFRSFGIWSISIFVAFLYAVFEVQDLLLAVVTGIDFLGCFLSRRWFSFGVNCRKFRKNCNKENPALQCGICLDIILKN